MNKKCKSLEESQSINDRCAYVNLPLSLQDFCIKYVSRSAIVLWTKIRALVGRSSDWSILISNKALGHLMGRTAHTIYIQLRELENIGLLEKTANPGKRSSIKVRFPQSLDQIKIIWRTQFKNEGGQKRRSYYINNNTNNNVPQSNDTVPINESAAVVVSASSETTMEIEILEKKREDVNAQLNEIHISAIKNKQDSSITYKKLRELGEQETALRIKISRLKPELPLNRGRPVDYLNSPGQRIICDFDKARLSRAKVPEKIKQEIAFAVRQRGLTRAQTGGELTVPHGISIALKLYRENRWQKPMGMPQ